MVCNRTQRIIITEKAACSTPELEYSEDLHQSYLNYNTLSFQKLPHFKNSHSKISLIPKTPSFQKLSHSKNSLIPKSLSFQKLPHFKNSLIPKTLSFWKLHSKNSLIPNTLSFQKLPPFENSLTPFENSFLSKTPSRTVDKWRRVRQRVL